jgi:hypothetical protein
MSSSGAEAMVCLYASNPRQAERRAFRELPLHRAAAAAQIGSAFSIQAQTLEQSLVDDVEISPGV